MIVLDLSWCKLVPKDLAEITSCLADNAFALRNINLSYNKLDFDERNEKDYEESEAFMDGIEQFLIEAMFVNHVNFSGMGLQEKQVRRLL